MARSTAEPSPTPPRRRRPVLKFLLILMLLPVLSVIANRFVPPPATLLMAQQALAGKGLDYRWRGLGDISPNLAYAVIASEDARFCAHDGFDFEAIEKAMDANRSGRKVRGGSTISQQTAKNVYLWPHRDWVRKGLEAGFTVMIETVWPKRRILEVYLNVAEFAPGVYGAEAAAHHWFDKSARDLTPWNRRGWRPSSPVPVAIMRPVRGPMSEVAPAGSRPLPVSSETRDWRPVSVCRTVRVLTLG